MLKNELIKKIFIRYKSFKILNTRVILFLMLFSLLLLSSSIHAEKYNIKTYFPAVKFAVITDSHVFETVNNLDNPLYLKYGIEDRKILKMSSKVLEIAINKIIDQGDIEFVILSGDLTDFGDKKTHQSVAEKLDLLYKNGIDVYVLPGNHDGFATKENKFKDIPRDIITPDEFSIIYNKYGYRQALYQDEDSLSYVVEPTEGLWLIMIDSCIYNKDNSYHVCNGKIKESTLSWIKEILKKAQIENKAVIGSLHHSILEHYIGQEKYFGDFLVDDWEQVSSDFAFLNLNYLFTGHHHANDIVKKEFSKAETDENSFLFDIETSSIIGYPNSFRTIEITENQMMLIRSNYIKNFPTFNGNFQDYTKKYLHQVIYDLAAKKIDKFHLNKKDKGLIANQAALAMMAHYKGNETPPLSIDIEELNIWSKFIYRFYRTLIYNLYHDPEPDDLNIQINLKDGSWSKIKN